MTPIYLNPIPGETQHGQRSYIGGKPKLPQGSIVPKCELCSSTQTFMFQLSVSEEAWSGETVAAFSCTHCADEGYLIPAMLDGVLRGADIPVEFLREYQKNFRFLTFPTDDGVLMTDYEASVEFRALDHATSPNPGCFGKIGGDAMWITEDESPATYAGSIPMVFVAEIYPGWRFTTYSGAEPQIELDIRGNPTPSPFDYYQLFLGNALFLFGPSTGEKLVYAITQ